MAGFFSPNSSTSEDQQPQPKHHNNNNNNNNNWLYRNHEPSSSSYYHYNNKEGTSTTYESWQPQPQPIYHSETIGSDGAEEYNRIMMMRRMSETSGSGTISCQDCGNQAKKDCEHMRCRTCCKSRGFDCATHVKSTWIPASVRRHRHHNNNPNPNEGQEQMGGGSSSNVKRRRDNNLPNIITSSSSSLIIPSQLPIITTPAVTTATATTSYGMELGNFPAEVSSPALFRCVRVSSMNDGDEEVAYQTAVRIGGHVFKGILYDQGPADNQHGTGGSGSGSGYGSGPLLNLAARPNTSTAAIVGSSSSALGYIDPSLYPAPLSPFMSPGTQFFPNPRP